MSQSDDYDDAVLGIVRENLRILVAKKNENLSQVALKSGMSRNGVQQFIKGHTSLSYLNIDLLP